MIIAVVTGGFDPLHTGHLCCFNEAKEKSDMLIVGVNSDDWLARKKGQPFMPYSERSEIVNNLKSVDLVMPFDDSDNTAISLLEDIKRMYPNDKIVFMNGGDRTIENIPELSVDGIDFAFYIGGDDKKNSSSWLLSDWQKFKTLRPWGYYKVLHADGPGCKLKELTVDPGKSLSMQKHDLRAEFWFVSSGKGHVYTLDNNGDQVLYSVLDQYDFTHLPKNKWHKLVNKENSELKIIEIQYGDVCIEEDITRLNDDGGDKNL